MKSVAYATDDKRIRGEDGQARDPRETLVVRQVTREWAWPRTKERVVSEPEAGCFR